MEFQAFNRLEIAIKQARYLFIFRGVLKGEYGGYGVGVILTL